MKTVVYVLIAIEDGRMHEPEVFTDYMSVSKKFYEMAREANRIIGVTSYKDRRIYYNIGDPYRMTYQNYALHNELYLYGKEIKMEV